MLMETFLIIPENNGTQTIVLELSNGVFAVDTPNGEILGLKKGHV